MRKTNVMLIPLVPALVPEADVLSGTALAETIQALRRLGSESRRWRDGDIVMANDQWRLAA